MQTFHTDYVDKLIRALSKSVSTVDLHMHNLLSESTCTEPQEGVGEEAEVPPNIGCTLTEFEEKDFVKFKEVELETHHNSVFKPITQNSFDMITALKREIQSYIPVEDVKDFQILDPARFPLDEIEQLTYGLTEINNIAVVYSLDANLVKEEWIQLLGPLTQHSEFCIHKSNIL